MIATPSYVECMTPHSPASVIGVNSPHVPTASIDSVTTTNTVESNAILYPSAAELDLNSPHPINPSMDAFVAANALKNSVTSTAGSVGTELFAGWEQSSASVSGSMFRLNSMDRRSSLGHNRQIPNEPQFDPMQINSPPKISARLLGAMDPTVEASHGSPSYWQYVEFSPSLSGSDAPSVRANTGIIYETLSPLPSITTLIERPNSTERQSPLGRTNNIPSTSQTRFNDIQFDSPPKSRATTVQDALKWVNPWSPSYWKHLGLSPHLSRSPSVRSNTVTPITFENLSPIPSIATLIERPNSVARRSSLGYNELPSETRSSHMRIDSPPKPRGSLSTVQEELQWVNPWSPSHWQHLELSPHLSHAPSVRSNTPGSGVMYEIPSALASITALIERAQPSEYGLSSVSGGLVGVGGDLMPVLLRGEWQTPGNTTQAGKLPPQY